MYACRFSYDIHYENCEASFLLGHGFPGVPIGTPFPALHNWTTGTSDQMLVLSVFCLWPVSWSFVVNSRFPMQHASPVSSCPEVPYLVSQ